MIWTELWEEESPVSPQEGADVARSFSQSRLFCKARQRHLGVQTRPLLGHGLTFEATEGDAWPPLPVQAGAARQGVGDIQGFPLLKSCTLLGLWPKCQGEILKQSCWIRLFRKKEDLLYPLEISKINVRHFQWS